MFVKRFGMLRGTSKSLYSISGQGLHAPGNLVLALVTASVNFAVVYLLTTGCL